MKIRVFLWQLVRKRLPTNGNIHSRHGPSTGNCALCGEFEDEDHIFFSCHLAKFMWSAVRELLSCTWNPRCFADIYRLLQGVQARRSEYYGLAVLPYAGPFGILGISLPLKGSSRRTQLIAYTKCLCTCRCGDQWLGDRIVTRWRRRLAGFALYFLPSGAREAPPAVILSLALV